VAQVVPPPTPRVDPLPALDELQSRAHVVRLPLVTRFRGVVERELLLLDGPRGWGEFSPFVEYGPAEASRWLAAAVEAGWGTWPDPKRDSIPVNAIVPAVDPSRAAALVRDSGGCRTAKVKVAEPGGSLREDVARVAAVAAALVETGPDSRLRVDANGGWSVTQAVEALSELAGVTRSGGVVLEYAEQPCASLAEQAEVRRRVDVPLATDEGLRKAADPRRVHGLREATDVLVVKVAPLGGVRAALAAARAYGVPVVVSSALDSSIGLAAGAALAGALDRLDHACGLGSGRLLAADVVADRDRVLPVDGRVRLRRPEPDPARLAELRAGPQREAWWRSRLADAYAIMARR
jgi:O-succinylbenzoate synthase